MKDPNDPRDQYYNESMNQLDPYIVKIQSEINDREYKYSHSIKS